MDYKEEDKPIVLPKPEDIPTGAIQHFKRFSAGAGASLTKITEEGITLGTVMTINEQGLDIGGTKIVDSSGLNSLNNFRSDTLFYSTSQNVTATSYTVLTGGTMASFILSRTTKVMTFLAVQGYHTGFPANTNYVSTIIRDTFDNAANQGVIITGKWGTSSGIAEILSIATLWSLAAGTHTFRVEAAVDANTGVIGAFSLDYFILGV
jgi:hypothetical protein